MLPVGLEPTISAGERPQTYALEPAATGTGVFLFRQLIRPKKIMNSAYPKRKQFLMQLDVFLSS